ncbi:MAG TPA: glycosyltransferase family 4 protein [Kofleriaceae bacterium]
MARVLITGFCAVPGPRRAGVQLRHLINALSPHHQVDLLVAREGEQAYVERVGNVRILRVPTQEADLKLQVQAFQRALRRQLDGADYDFVHCRDSWSGIPVLEARDRLGYAVVYDLARSPLGETTFDTELDGQYGRDEEACLLAADLVLAPTPAAVKALQGRGRPERVFLSPPGVDVDRFDWDDMPKSGPPRILYVGSIDPGRGVRVLVRAMAAIVREIDARLVLAGSMAPKFDQGLRDGIRELGLLDKVDILGPIEHEHLPTLYATAAVCVVPAAADLSPNPTAVYPTKLLEYMACRTAIVAPRRDTVMQVVTDQREALLFEPGDPVDLARSVMRLLEEPALRTKLAQNAYERVRRDFTASAARRALRTAYAVLTERFADEINESVPIEKIEVDHDDEFDATVFEEAPVAPAVDTALNKMPRLDDALASLDDPTGDIGRGITHTDIGDIEPAPLPRNLRAISQVDDEDSAEHTPALERVTTEMAMQPDEGTPLDGVRASTPRLVASETNFAAGEIDVPSPAPERERTPSVEIAVLNDAPDPDTGSRTPPLERR